MHQSPAVSMAKAFMVEIFKTSHNVLEKNIRGWQILLKKSVASMN
jgi:hypothetical protein